MSTPSVEQSTSVQDLLGDDRPPHWWQRPVWLAAMGLVAAAGAVYWYQSSVARRGGTVYLSEPVRKGNVTLTVSANGTLQPLRTVTVGSELSGTVAAVLVDVNDQVKVGQELLQLEKSKFADQVARSRAALGMAQAQVQQYRATLQETRAVLARQEEVARVSGGLAPAAADLDTARANVERAAAALANGEAAADQARAQLSTDETNLRKTSIRSPIDGTVIARTVEPGNAVAASLQAVTLLTIAQDLTRMRVEAAVDEADVGALRNGQKASFTVSSYPSRQYPGKVTRVAFGPTKTDNVITYTTYIDVDNHDLSLRPGMTAVANIVATERQGVLLVPNTALRYAPITSNGASGGGLMSHLMPRPPATARKTAKADTAAGSKQLWVLRDGQPVAVRVTTGISDGRVTEVSGDDIREGMNVITDQRAGGANP